MIFCRSAAALALFVLSLSISALSLPAIPLGPVEIKVSKDFLAGNDTVIYLEDLESGMVYAVNGKKVEARHPPFSSFKIPNFLIALETGALDSSEAEIPYDSARRPAQSYWPADWAQDQTLHTAFQRSAAWAFQDLALKIGTRTYEGYLSHFAYGNRECKGDGFWLDRSLKISPKEQVDFLRKLLTDQLEVAPVHIDQLKKAALAKSEDGFRLYGKTGSGPVKSGDFSGPFEGWYVGWLERPDRRPVLFALWTTGPDYQSIKSYRQNRVERVLEQAGYLPLNWRVGKD